MLKNYQSLNWRTFRAKVYQFGVFVALILGVTNQSNAQTYLSEGFESGIPAAWTQEYVASTQNWTQATANGNSTVTARTGTNLALFMTTTAGDATKLVTPSMDLSGATNPTLTFYYTNVGFLGGIDELRVYYKTSAGGTWTQIGVDYTAEMTSWKEVILSLPNPSADYYIAFEGYSNWANGVTLDDITVENITCPKPTNLSAITTLNNANLSWIAGAGETSWNIEWGVSGFTQGTGTVINGVTTNPYTLNGLSAATSYQYYIQADCGGGDLSSWAGPFTFTTPCVATNIPYLEDFELATIPNMPSCTSIENAGSGNNWTTNNGNSSLLSTNVLSYEYNSSNAANAWFYTRGLNLTAGTSYRLKFDYTNEDDFYMEKMRVAIGQSAANASMTTQLLDFPSISTLNLEQGLIDFTVPTSGVYYIGFNAYSDVNEFNLYVDNISVDLSPSCTEPTAVTTSNATTTSADVSWIAPAVAPANGYAYYVNTTNTIPATATGTVGAGVTTANLTGLNPSTQYYVWIKSICGVGDSSTATASTPFATPCVATNIPYLEDFELATIPNMPSCTSIENAGTGNNWTTDNGNSSLLSTNVLYYEYNSTDAANAWFYTRGLNLTAGTSYRLKFDYTNEDDYYIEKMRVAIGQSAANASMTTQLLDFPSISTLNLEQGLIDFTVPTSGVYYIGFNAYSDADEFNLYVDNISVDLSPSCIEPTSVTTSNVATTTADVSWTAPAVAPANGYAYYVNTTNTIPSTATGTVGAGVTTANLTGLTDATTYYVWVKSVCGAGDTSMATSLVTFTTPCVATNIPYLEDFELATIPNMPSCTSIENAGSGNNWTTDNGNSMLLSTNVLSYEYNSSNAANAWFYTRGLNLTAGTSYRLKFDYTNEDDYYIEKMRVAIGQSAANANMTTQLLDFPSISTLNLEQGLIDFTVPTSGVYYIGFNAYSDVDEFNLYVDNISVDLSPSCVEPHSLTTNATSSTTGSVKWNQSLSNPANGYQYYVSTSNTAPTNTTTPTGTTVSGDTTVNLTGLTADMTYYVWVRSMCSSSDTSAWTNVSSFYTGYCIPVSDYTDTYIDSVYTVGGIVNIQKNATGYENTGYANNFSTDSLVIMKGDTVTMHFYLEAPYDAGVALYIDTNNNMIFDANEMISSSNSYIASGSYSFQYSVPATMQPGTYRARLIADYGLDNPLACSFTDILGSEGEAEDYKIVVVPACTPPTVDLGADTTICAGNSVTLDAGNTGLSYVWSNNAVSQTITVNAAGKYFVTVKDGVCSTMDSIQVTITPNPTVSIQASKLIACPNDTIVLTANGASTYLWNDNSTDTVRTVYPTQTTTYSVTGKNGNCSASASVSIAIKTTGCETGLEDMDLTNVSVYPNPASSTVRIVGEELTQYYQSITVVDLTGRTVIEMPIRSNEESIHVSNLVNGIYFVNLQGKQTKTVKIEVKH